MSLIYEPKGRAREYSPLALNIYNGCSHRCKYCYLRNINKLLSKETPTPKKDILQKLEKQLNKSNIQRQVLLSFVSDIYCKGANLTKEVLNIFLKYQIPISILTKNKRVIEDIEIFKKFDNISIGFTLTFDNQTDSLNWEPGASIPEDRFEALKILHENNIKTFASLEPVIKPDQSLNIIKLNYKNIDLFKIGKLNNYKGLDKNIDWNDFGKKAVNLCLKYNKNFYIKKDLYEKMENIKLKLENTNPDFWSLKKKHKQFSLF